MLVNPSGAEPTECIYPRAAVAPLPGPGLKISQPLRGCRELRLSEHGRATPSDTIYCIYLCISPEGVGLFITPVCVSAASTDWGRQYNNEAAPKGLTSIFDAKIPLFVSCADTRTSVPTFRNAAQGCGRSNERPYKWMFIAVQACGRPQQRAPKTTP